MCSSDLRLGKGDVLGDGRVQVMADHQHVQVLVERIHRVRARRVGRRRQHVGLAADLDDVGRVAAARALRVEGVDAATGDRADGGLDVARLVEAVGVQGDLQPELVGCAERGVDRRGGRTPVLVDLVSRGACERLLGADPRPARLWLREHGARLHAITA